MRFTQIPETTFKELQLNAGVLMRSFDPETAEVSGIEGATTGGIKFSAVPSWIDMGEDIDNCPKNMMELKELDTWDIKMSGTYVSVNAASIKNMIAAADVSGNKITPRNDILEEDFKDLWWVGDYSDKNGDSNGGFIAIHMMNGLSTGGFQIQTGDRSKGQFAFEFTGHYSIKNQAQVPFEVYIQAGTDEAAANE